MSPVRPGQGAARAVAIVLVGGLAVLAFLLSTIRGGASSERRSAFSAERDGRLAAYLLLRDLDFPARAWTDAPGLLPRARAVLWLPEAPEEPPGYLRDVWRAEDAAEDDAQPGPRSFGRARDPRHYRRFVEEGGTILTGLDRGRREFVADVLGLEVPPEVERAAPLELVTLQGEEVAYASGREAALLAVPRGSGEALVVAAADPAQVFALALPLGRGRVVVVPDDDAFGNRGIREADHALLLVRLFEAMGAVEEVLFDEYALGTWTPETPLELALSKRSFAFTLHLAFALLVFVWSLAAAGAFPRDPEEHRAASPRARARAFGATMARLGRHDLLGDWLRSGVAARLPGAGRRAAPEPDGAEARGRALLAPLAHLARSEEELARWTRALTGPPPTDARGLEALAGELARVERLASGAPRGHNHGFREADQER